MVKIGKKGSKGKYQDWLTEEKLLLLEGWARQGLIDEQIAKNIGITAKTLYDWKNNHSDICKALKKGKEVIDIQVENALLKNALGYAFIEETIENGRSTKKIKKHMPPDTTAQIFWLKNRRPDLWREKQQFDIKTAISDDGFIEALKAPIKGLWDAEQVEIDE